MTEIPPPASITTLVVADEYDGWRLDRFVAALAPQVSRTRVQALIAAGHITLDGKPAKASQTVETDDVVALSGAVTLPAVTLPQPENIPLAIVYEDEHLIVVDKPAGMVVHPAAGHDHGTLVNALLGHTTALGGEPTRPGIVHRLDRDTSGLIIVAKDDATLVALGEQMRARTITKVYLALVEGVMQQQEGAIEAPIGRDPRHRQRMAIVSQGGRAAKTLFAVERMVDGRTLVRATLVTGRTHQIRVHFAAIGHPVAGDLVYGRPQPPQPPRQFLHAHHLAFAHPITGAPLAFTSPLPPDLAKFLAELAGEND
ncbi:MAG TPA: RluA family pseudouridine synthase [Ktedonobacterales bacterium]|nr:RluA family pseudouridine synthase [Ktedonobacterales bacterium]